MNVAVSEFIDYINEPGKKLIDKHTIYLERALRINKRIPIFYCIPKVHKKKTPTPLHPAIAIANTKLYYLEK